MLVRIRSLHKLLLSLFSRFLNWTLVISPKLLILSYFLNSVLHFSYVMCYALYCHKISSKFFIAYDLYFICGFFLEGLLKRCLKNVHNFAANLTAKKNYLSQLIYGVGLWNFNANNTTNLKYINKLLLLLVISNYYFLHKMKLTRQSEDN